MKKICLPGLRALLVLGLTLCLCLPAFADGMPDDAPLTFSDGVFSAGAGVRGVFLTEVPEEDVALLCLGGRQLRAGDAVPVRDLPRLTLIPAAENGGEAAICFLPVGEDGILEAAVLTMHIQPAGDQPPRALDLELETYRNIPNTGVLRAVDEEDGPLTYQLAVRPKRGTVELDPDGSFTYTPKKNKVGEDSFSFTATDGAGNVSEPGVVRIRILKPSDAQTFSDLAPEAQFPALWLRETGLFGGELLNDRLSFGPEKTVTRGEFMVMLMAMQGIEPDIGLQRSGFADEADAPLWMRPYLASAMRRGIVQGSRTERGLCFLPGKDVTAAEAEEMLARVLERETASSVRDEAAQIWAEGALLQAAGISGADRPLTRMEAARLLYQASLVA